MSRRDIFRILAAVFGGLAVGMALLGGLIMLDSGRGFSASAAGTALGWMIPVFAGVVVGIMAWLLLADSRAMDAPGPSLTDTCSECGRPVASDWRLCPYCGAITQVPLRDPRREPVGDTGR